MSLVLPTSIPLQATLARSEFTAHGLADAEGNVRDDARMLVSPPIEGPAGMPPMHQFLYYFKPNEDQLAQLHNGGFVEVCLVGVMPQPLGLSIWGAPVALREAVAAELADGHTDAEIDAAGEPVPTDDQVAAFKAAWRKADAQGLDGERVRAGLRAALAVTP